MSVEDLIIRLCIEKDNKVVERRSRENSAMKGANIVEYEHNSKNQKKSRNESSQPKKKFKGKCFNYGKIGQKSIDCRAPKKEKKNDQANVVESKKEMDYLCAMLSKCNLVGNPRKMVDGFQFVQKKITLVNQQNKKLVGVLHDTRSLEIMVFCRGFRSSKSNGTDISFRNKLPQSLCSAVACHYCDISDFISTNALEQL
ncbi:hypothetical protein BC332_18623 [Capsicum chinense]|nr:hypothetical protein BC332_18623 [Capsicum chinense]